MATSCSIVPAGGASFFVLQTIDGFVFVADELGRFQFTRRFQLTFRFQIFPEFLLFVGLQLLLVHLTPRSAAVCPP